MPKRTPSPAQIEASRRNGARSRGPLSAESRARSARNSLKHGLTANTILLDGESQERFQQLLDDLLADLCPESTLEFSAVEEIAVALWKQRRSWAMEAAFYRESSGRHPATSQDAIGRATQAWRQLHKRGHDFHNLLTQQARVNHQLDRAYRRFRDFAALRAALAEPDELSVFEHQNSPLTATPTPQPIETTSADEETALVKNEPDTGAGHLDL